VFSQKKEHALDKQSATSCPHLLPTRRAQHQLFRANQPRAPAHAFPSPLPWQLPTGFRAARAPPARPRPRAQWVASARDPPHAQQPKAPRLPLPLPHEHPSHTRARRVRLLAMRIASLFPRSPDVCLPPLTEASEHQRHHAPLVHVIKGASHRQRRSSSPSTRHIRARSRVYNHHGGIQGRC
jgi:hypothetical protein